MDVAMEASREIMWNIPFWMKLAMYLALAAATAVFALGLVDKYKYVTQGKNPKQIPHRQQLSNWKTTLKLMANL
jgi:hypothetical protein